jgi:hypothetical protein
MNRVRIARTSLTLLGILLMQTGFSAAGNLSDIPAVRGGLEFILQPWQLDQSPTARSD